MFRRYNESITMPNYLVKNMSRRTSVIISAVGVIGLAACGTEKVEEAAVANEVEISKSIPEVSFKPTGEFDGTVAKPGSPYSISYRIVGTPIVGSPVTIDLQVASSLGPRPVTIDYRINDATSMLLSESQPARVSMEPAANEKSFKQQVTVIPQREGRLYLNVSASFETEDGTMSTVAAIPIQVGTGTRELQEHGELGVDENGQAVRVLSSD